MPETYQGTVKEDTACRPLRSLLEVGWKSAGVQGRRQTKGSARLDPKTPPPAAAAMQLPRIPEGVRQSYPKGKLPHLQSGSVASPTEASTRPAAGIHYPLS